MIIIETNPAIKDLVDANDGYCPCAVEHTKETECMCKDFKEQDTPGPCHCGRYEKVEE